MSDNDKDDKKRDRALQRRVRERQEKTGESYQAAWRQLTDSDAPNSAAPPPDTEIDSNEDGADAQILADNNEQLTRINAQMFDETIRGLDSQNQNLHEQIMTLTKELEEARSEKREVADHDGLIIPLQLPRVPPHQPTRVTARAAKGAVDIKAIYISGAGTPGGTADWVVNDIEIDGRSQLAHKDLPGALFGGKGIAGPTARHATTKLLLEGFDPLERDRELVLVVTYVGPNPKGMSFFASAVGQKPRQRPTIVPIASKSPLLPAAKATTITAHVRNAPFQMERLEIDDEGTAGGSADWIVQDLRINGRSQFVHPGNIPGDLFSTTAIDTFVKLEACEAGSAIEVDVIYIGLNERGAIFAARFEGTVLRDDYSVVPPDLHVIVETIGQGPADTVVATCNWRAPASDNCTR